MLSIRPQHGYCKARVTFAGEGPFFIMGTVYFSTWKGFFCPCYPADLSGAIVRSAIEGPSFIMGTALCYWKGWFFWVPRVPLSAPPSSFPYSMPSMKTCPLDWGGLNGHRIYLQECVRESWDTLALLLAQLSDGLPDLVHDGQQLCTSLHWITGTRARKGHWLQF